MVALRKILILAGCAALALAAAAGATVKRSWLAAGAADAVALNQGGAPRMSDVIQDIWVDGSAVWVATVDGLGVTRDRGSSWRTYRRENGLPSNDVVAVAAREGDIWASCIEVIDLGFGNYTLEGRGLAHYDGAAGRWYVYGKEDGLPADALHELAWDVVVDDDGVVWVALWDGGIGKSEDNGKTWQLIIPKEGTAEASTHFYSLAKRGDLIWAAAELDVSTLENVLCGVFKSEDNGSSWSYYPLQHGVKGLCAIVDIQNAGGGNVVWVGTVPALGPGTGPGNGVFKSEDGGATWLNYRQKQGIGLSSDIVYAFASAGPWAWGGTYDGVARTNDGGASWTNSSTESGLPWYAVNALAAESERYIWAGTDLGLGISSDGGATWRKIDLTPPAGRADLPKAFAFPSPFSPYRDGFITIRYGLAYGGTVTLDIYDFAGRRVRRLVNGEYRGPGDRIDEIWRGEREDGAPAANGIYFFTLQVDGEAAARGKFVVLD
jgi:hypothetical protein